MHIAGMRLGQALTPSLLNDWQSRPSVATCCHFQLSASWSCHVCPSASAIVSFPPFGATSTLTQIMRFQARRTAERSRIAACRLSPWTVRCAGPSGPSLHVQDCRHVPSAAAVEGEKADRRIAAVEDTTHTKSGHPAVVTQKVCRPRKDYVSDTVFSNRANALLSNSRTVA